MGEAARNARDIAAEALWPTRCAICDAPGEVLCSACASKLRYLDQWQACPRCGAPFGRIACTECNPIALGRLGRKELPYRSCASATIFSPEAGSIVRLYKDGDEKRLSKAMASMMARSIPPDWRINAVTFVPATKAAARRRGFDHGLLLATELGALIRKPVVATLESPHTADQRGLTREERLENLAGRFSALDSAKGYARLTPTLLLIDDVYTTGSTLCAATDALLAAGFEQVYCATFTRVY